MFLSLPLTNVEKKIAMTEGQQGVSSNQGFVTFVFSFELIKTDDVKLDQFNVPSFGLMFGAKIHHTFMHEQKIRLFFPKATNSFRYIYNSTLSTDLGYLYYLYKFLKKL